MKKIALILIMILLTLTSCGKERIEDMSKLEIRNGKNYLIGEDKPYTGTFQFKISERNKSVGKYKQNQRSKKEYC